MEKVRDNVAMFGRFGGLVGIISERIDGPVSAAVGGTRLPGIIILNTGIIHRVGAGRISTLWARHIAGGGHCVLRFDLSGIGDSERRGDTLPPIEAAMADVSDAIDWLQSARGVHSVILIGLCSGADLSLVYSGTDSRVCGMVIIDPTTPRTFRHYLRKIATLKVWRRRFQVIVDRTKAKWGRSLPTVAPDSGHDDPPPLEHVDIREIFSRAYQTAFARSVKALGIFTSGADWYSYPRQLFDAFPEIDFDGNLQLEYFERCDHAISHEANRARLYEVVDAWLWRTEFKLSIAAVPPHPQSPVTSGLDSCEVTSMEF